MQRACIRTGVLQCASCFYPRNPHATGCFGFETSLVCIELVLIGIARGDSEMALFLCFFPFLSFPLSCGMLGPGLILFYSELSSSCMI